MPPIRQDAVLTQMSIGFINEPGSYLHNMVSPPVPVDKRQGLIPKYDQSPWFRNGAQERATGTKSVRGGFSTDIAQQYYCRRYSFGFEIADEDRNDTIPPFDQDRDGTLFATDKVSMKKEINCATAIFASSVWTTDLTGGVDFTAWSDYALSTPLVDITTYASTISGLIGMDPNQAIMGQAVWDKLKWHPDLLDTIKYTQTAMMSTGIFGSLIEIPAVFVGKGIYTTDPEGTAEASVTYSRIWGAHFLLQYTNAMPALMRPSGSYNLTWNRVSGAPIYILRHRDDEREVDILEANAYCDYEVTSANSGAFLASAVA